MFNQIWCLLIFFLVLTKVGFSQQVTKHLTTENGLPSNAVYSCGTDSKGYVWIGTDKGLVRYDGLNLKSYTIDEGITDNEVFKTFEDSQQRLWIITYNGEPCFIKQNKIYTKENSSFLKSFTNNYFFTDVIEHKGNLYFFKEGSSDYSIVAGKKVSQTKLSGNRIFICSFKWNGMDCILSTQKSSNTIYDYSILPLRNISSPLVEFSNSAKLSSVIQLNKNLVLAGTNLTDRSLQFFRLENPKTGLKTLQAPASEGEDKIYFVKQINKEWFFTTNNGVLVYDNNFGFKRKILNGNWVTSIAVDFEGGIWFSTKNNGVFYLKNTQFHVHSQIEGPVFFIRKNPFEPNEFYFISENSFYVVGNNKTVKVELPKEMGKNEVLTDLVFLDSKTVLMGNGNGLLLYAKGQFKFILKHNGLKQFFITGDSILAAKSSELTIQHLNQIALPKNVNKQPYRTLKSGRVLCVWITPSGKMYYGDNKGAYTIEKNEVKPIAGIDSRVQKIVSAGSNLIAFASDINGVFVLQNNSVVHYSLKDGLLSNSVNYIHFDSKNKLWVSSNKGLSCIDVDTKIIKNYGLAHNLPVENINDFYFVNDSVMWVATPAGLFEYCIPVNLDIKRPRMEIESIHVNSKPFNAANLLNLEYSQNNIELLLSGISYKGGPIEFYYTINNSGWKKVNGRLLTFVGLPPGEFNLQVKSKNAYEKWSRSKIIKLVIKPPFYKTWTFLILIFLLSVLSVLSVFIFIQRKKNRERAFKAQLTESREKAFRAQLNPHFIFNALNSIQFLYLSNKEEEAVTYLNKFSVLLRSILDNSSKSFVCLVDECKNLELYLEIEQMRIGKKFTYKVTIDPSIDVYNVFIPGMLIQPFVENAVWHAFNAGSINGQITISITKLNDDEILVSIVDNGVGFDYQSSFVKVDQHGKVRGLQIIRERINALNYANTGKVKLAMESDKNGTKVFLTLPITF